METSRLRITGVTGGPLRITGASLVNGAYELATAGGADYELQTERQVMLDNILFIPGIAYSFRSALRDLAPYSPRLAANFMDPAGSLYTDASRTTQVTTLGNRIRSFTNFVTGQPHGAASSDAKSPLWNEFLVNGRAVRGAVFDSVDDCLQVSDFDLSTTDKVCAIVGVRKNSDSTLQVMIETSPTSSSNNGTFALSCGSLPNRYRWNSRGDINPTPAAVTSSQFDAPASHHLGLIGDISGDLSIIRINGSQIATATGDQGLGNLGNYTLNIGGRDNGASLRFGGSLSYLFICGAIPPVDVLTKIYRGLAPQIGVAV